MNEQAKDPATKSDRAETMNCSFCGRDSKQVKQLVAGGSGGFICDKCAWLSMIIVAKDPRGRQRDKHLFRIADLFAQLPRASAGLRGRTS